MTTATAMTVRSALVAAGMGWACCASAAIAAAPAGDAKPTPPDAPVAAPVKPAAPAANVNTLSEKEVAEGWLLLFDGETTFGWKVEGGEAKVEDGWLKFQAFEDFEFTATFATPFEDFELGFDSRCAGGRTNRLVLQGGKRDPWQSFDIPDICPPGAWVGRHMTYSAGTDNTVRFTGKAAGQENPANIEPQTGAYSKWTKQITFQMKGSAHAIRNVKLRPLGSKPLFNGKDLTGWKEFPGKKSKWSVDEGGVLRVKDGPGDLATEAAFADFILQAEVKTHGKALNSGFFFRCIAGQYQNGYEAQVQNGFKDGDRTKPADFGTGAIYRRIPARRVVADDEAWFTLTIAARGTHIATWVNGIQVVDWTDDRPADENPRKGSKVGAGHISIQGHDPTTDLSFRNIRVIDLADTAARKDEPGTK